MVMTDTFLALVALCGGGIILIVNFWIKNNYLAIVGALFWFMFGIHCVVQGNSADPAYGNLTWAFGILAFILALMTWYMPRMLRERQVEDTVVDEAEEYHEAQQAAWANTRRKVGKRD